MLFVALSARSQDLTVLANEKGAPAQLKLTELKSIFTGKTVKWGNGSKIILALMKTNTDAGKNTCEKVFGMNGDEVKKYWLTQSMKGSEAPAFFNSAAELREFLSKNPGAIGILDGSETAPGTRIVLIDGKKTI